MIADSMQLISGRSGQQYNQRKGRHGAFWEERYQSTAIEAGEHLYRCLIYIDLNMVHAGVVMHPSEWAHSGYREIQNPPKRYGSIDLRELISGCGIDGITDFQKAHREWVKESLSRKDMGREANWSEAIALGSLSFVNKLKGELGFKAAQRGVTELGASYALREEGEAYGHNLGVEK